MAEFFSETIHDGYRQSFEVTRWLVDERSDYQSIKIFDSRRNGRVLVLDEAVQITSRDFDAYAEMLAHVPYYSLTAGGHGPKRVLIIGGGDATVAQAVLRHSAIESVDMAEIDPRVIALCREHFSEFNGEAFADPRLNIHIVDAFAFLESGVHGPYDIIIADRPDPVGPGAVLFADRFYELIRGTLSPHGIAVFQTGAPFFQAEELREDVQRLSRLFAHAGAYLTVVPTYVGGFMTLTWASQGTALHRVPAAEIEAAWNAAPVPTSYYDPAVHAAAFALPVWIRKAALTGTPGAPAAGADSEV